MTNLVKYSTKIIDTKQKRKYQMDSPSPPKFISPLKV